MRKKNTKAQAGGGAPSGPPPILSAVGPAIDAATMRIRMLKSAATTFGPLNAGTVHNIPTKVAQGWIAAGIAEQDKALDGPPETK